MCGVTYMPHQLKAINELRSGSILCGGVGTGKSITALGYFIRVECRSVSWNDGVDRGPLMEPKPLYIITTARKRDTHEWEAECDNFKEALSSIPITIDSWNNLHKYADVQDAFFMFDEQRVVGHGAWVKAFLKITKRNRWILLSATPGDSWMDYIPVFVANGFYKNRSQFLRIHAVYNRYSQYPKVDRWVEVGHLEDLRRRITVTMHYQKHTVRHYEDIETDYDHEKYKRISEDRWDPFEDEPIQDISGVCRLLRKVVNSDATRMEAVESLIKEHPRVIIFYNYDYELEMLRTLSALVPVAEWNGHRHDRIPDSCDWIYLVQYAAGSEGWNCVDTDTVIFFSQNYSYKMMEQAAGRIDRINTPFTDLYYYTLKSRSSIDAAIARALRGKKTFNEKQWMKKDKERNMLP